MTEDIIKDLSQSKSIHKKKYETPVLFPEIPDPPEGFDPEANILFQDVVPHSERAVPKKADYSGMVPKARVFLVGPEGNSEYELILQKGIEGSYVLGKKEVLDMKGSDKFKVYLEWIELSAKKGE